MTFEELRACMRTALELDDAQAAAITPETTAAQLPAWTSMKHLELVLAIERQLTITFDAEEIANLASVSSILAALQRERTT